MGDWLQQLRAQAYAALDEAAARDSAALDNVERLVAEGKLIKVQGDWYALHGINSRELGAAWTGKFRKSKSGECLVRLKSRSNHEANLRKLEGLR